MLSNPYVVELPGAGVNGSGQVFEHSKIFEIKDEFFSTPEPAIRTAMGVPITDLTDIPSVVERTIAQYFRMNMVELANKQTSFLLVIDISTYPRVAAYIDTRDQVDPDDTSDFGQAITKYWTAFNIDVRKGKMRTSDLPCIVVNPDISSTGLKLIPWRDVWGAADRFPEVGILKPIPADLAGNLPEGHKLFNIEDMYSAMSSEDKEHTQGDISYPNWLLCQAARAFRSEMSDLSAKGINFLFVVILSSSMVDASLDTQGLLNTADVDSLAEIKQFAEKWKDFHNNAKSGKMRTSALPCLIMDMDMTGVFTATIPAKMIWQEGEKSE